MLTIPVYVCGRYNDWGPEAATALYQDLKAAGKGFLEKVTPGETLRGVENGGNTCYIDRLAQYSIVNILFTKRLI